MADTADINHRTNEGSRRMLFFRVDNEAIRTTNSPPPMSAADDSTITPSELQIRSGLAYLDDSVVALRQVRKQAGLRGVLVECFSDLDLFVGRMSADPPLHAVLLDVDLGGAVDGPAVAERLRAAIPAVKIAFFTAEKSDERARQLTHLGPVFDKHRDLPAVLAWFDERWAEL
jgi:hypothetical protein